MGKTHSARTPAKRNARPPRPSQNGSNHRAATRSSKAKLTNGLEDPAQVERELNAQLKTMSLYAANTIGDGNCLWRALSDQLYGYPNHHAELRREVCDHLEALPEKYAGFVDNDQPFDQYVRLMRQNGTYGGHLELSAFASLKGKVIKVVQPGLVYLVGTDIEDEPTAIARERERERVQNSTAPGSEVPPPSEREVRRKRRESRQKDLSPVKGGALAPEEAEAESSVHKAPIEAYGPLYIAYHNWEHYSSIRNLGGPHQGLPRIVEQRRESAEASASAPLSSTNEKGKGRGTEPAHEVAFLVHDNPEWTEDETVVMQSCPGHDHLEVRRLLKKLGSWEEVVEELIARDAAAAEAAIFNDGLTPATGGASTLARRGVVPDHLRDWRAVSPSSVETSGTARSSEAGSTSTAATTTEEGPSAGAGPFSPRFEDDSSTVPLDRRAKRAASSDPMGNAAGLCGRSPKRRSRSRSPATMDEDEDARQASLDARAASPSAASVDEATVTAYTPDVDSDFSGGPAAAAGRRASRRTTARQLSTPQLIINTTRKDTTEVGGASTAAPTKRAGAKPKPLTAREKRDAAQAKKKERALEKARGAQSRRLGKGWVQAEIGNGGAEEGTPRPEVKGFVELKI